MGEVAIWKSAGPLKRAGRSALRHLYSAQVAGPSVAAAWLSVVGVTQPPNHCRATPWHTAAAACHMPYAPAESCVHGRQGCVA